jgi:hypothetical protein
MAEILSGFFSSVFMKENVDSIPRAEEMADVCFTKKMKTKKKI